MSAVDGIDEFAAQLAGILKEKNESYGDSLAKVPTMLSFIFPEIPVEKLTLICAFSRALEKFGRMASNPTAFGEDPWTDVAGGFLVHANIDRLKREAKAKPGISVDSIYDEPDDSEAPSDAPAVVPASVWVIKRDAEGGPLFLCTFDAGRPEWSPSEERAIRYLSRRAADTALAHHLPATTKGVAVESPKAESPSEPNGRIKRDMAHAEVTQEPTGWYIVCFEGRDRQFFNDFGGFWAHDIRDATSFLSQEAAESCLRRREGSPCE